MPRTPQQNVARREQRQQEILRAALRVYVANGYHGTEIAAIAREAQVATGLIHYYFKTKQELFQTLFREQKAQSEQFNQELFKVDLPPPECVRFFLTAYLEAAIEDPANVLFFQRALQDQRDVMGAELDEFLTQTGLALMNFLQSTIEAGMTRGDFGAGQSYLLAVLLLGAVEGALRLLANAAFDQQTKQAMARETVEYCLAMLPRPSA